EDLRMDLGRFLGGEQTVAERDAALAAVALGGAAAAMATTMQPATTVGAAVPAVDPVEEEEEEKKPKTALFIGILVVLLLALGGLLFWFVNSSGGADVAVPSLIGLTRAEAETQLKDADLVPKVTTEPSATIAVDLVISQDPGKDVTVKSGSTVNLVVSSGIETVELPDVTGLAQAEAEKQLIAKGLLVKITPQESADIASGTVISQSPAALVPVAVGSVVELMVSKGVGEELVPDVVGQPLAQAQAAIQAAGFRFANPTQATSATVPTGSVISTDPSGGTSVAANTLIRIVVSTGPEQAKVPTVVGQSEADATTTIKFAGLSVRVVPQTVPAGDPNAGRVISQDPAGGKMEDKGSAVTITVGVAAAATTTTTTTTVATTTSAP
ncbi:MAG: PASTA domain-containing protein, partial [Actinobacteria bacterium]|nr:PASTA domain-containing protein [Actinomycetota bacterium]